MTEFWRLFIYIGGGLIFTISVLDSGYRGFRYFKKGKKSAGTSFSNRVKRVIAEDRHTNCPWLITAELEAKNRARELDVLKETIITELKPIREDIADIKEIQSKLHHAQMTDLQIKLSSLFHERFDKKGVLTKLEQSNWDKWFSDYHALGGNSDIKKMDELIQKARLEATLDKARVLKTQPKKEETSHED